MDLFTILFDSGLFNKVCDKIKYLISKTRGITNIINHNIGKIRIDSYRSSPIKKIFTFHNVLTHIKSFVNKNKNKYCYNIFLEKFHLKIMDVSEGIDANINKYIKRV